jgi:hypothetical protein
MPQTVLLIHDDRAKIFARIFEISPNIPVLVHSSLQHANAAKLAGQLGAQDPW